MKKKHTRFVLPCDIYHADIYVSAGGTCKDAVRWWRSKNKHLGEIDVSDIEDRVGTVLGGDKSMGCLLWFYSTSPGVGTLSHECFHVACTILNNAGARLNKEKDAEEAFAYLIGWLTREIGLRLWTKKKPKRRR